MANQPHNEEPHFRRKVLTPPKGRDRFKWYGPGFLWMLSAVGTGSILFTPRVASAYEYQLLWVLLIVVFFMWVMIREMARFSIVSGHTMLEGMHNLPGPRDWAVWAIFLPQLIAAAVGIAGLSAVVGSALGAFLPGGNTVYAAAMIFLSTVFTATGRYSLIERFSRLMALALMIMAVIAAIVVFPGLSEIANGLTFTLPNNPDLYVILPWIGTILAGSMGIVWFGYWTATRGYGGGLEGREPDDEMPSDTRKEHEKTDQSASYQFRTRQMQDWVRVMSVTGTLGVTGGLIVIFSFLVLGAELLAPEGCPRAPMSRWSWPNSFPKFGATLASLY